MSFIRILASALFLSVISSQAIAAGGQIEIAQFVSPGQGVEYKIVEDGEAADKACQGKSVGTACSYHSIVHQTQMNGTCKQLPPREVGYGTMIPQGISCK